MSDLLYSTDHAWVRVEGDYARVGISRFAQSELGDIVFIELPAEGSVLESGEVACSIDSMKSTSEVYAPIGGRIVGVNRGLETEEGIALINKDPSGDGWIFLTEIIDRSELDHLMSEQEYQAFLDQ